MRILVHPNSIVNHEIVLIIFFSRIEGTMVAPIHALLQALPGVEAVTTNYDTLYERAVIAAGKSISVLPYQDTKGTTASRKSKWLLKMHGCVSRPQDIVLTREDYIRYKCVNTLRSLIPSFSC